MRKLLLICLLFIGLSHCPFDPSSYADSICVDCDESSITTTLVDAGDFEGSDIGAKINAAIDSFTSGKEGTVYVPPASWCSASYATMISLDKPVTVIFPGSTCQATYTGTVAALKQTGAGSRGKTIGFAVTESGNVNADVDGILIDATDAQLTDCGHSWLRLSQIVRHGINLEAKNNGIFQCSFDNGRIDTVGGNNINIDSTGSSTANSNTFNKLTLNGTPASFNAVRIADGYANSFRDIYIQSGNATAQSVYNSGDFVLFENIIVDSSMTLGIKADAGNVKILGIQNNATGTAYSTSATGKIYYEPFGGTYYAADGTAAAPAYSFAANTNAGFRNANGIILYSAIGVDRIGFAGTLLGMRSDVGLAWSSTTTPVASLDTFLYREAANRVRVYSVEGAAACFTIDADEGDDVADSFTLCSNADNTLTLLNGVTVLATWTATGELNLVGVAAETSNAVCVKSDGNLGTCTDAVGVTGECTCS